MILSPSTSMLIFLIEPLHGISFTFCKLSLITKASQISPPNLQTTTLVIIELFFSCFGKGSGMLIVGWVYEGLGGKFMWGLWAAALVSVAGILYWFGD